MSLETDLLAKLKTVCPRVFIKSAPFGTQMPYITWQHAGGDPLIYLDQTQADKRHALIQVNCYDATALGSFGLMQAVQAVLLGATPALTARPLSEPVDAVDDADNTLGYLQTYSIYGAR